jgi:hypothetical protein
MDHAVNGNRVEARIGQNHVEPAVGGGITLDGGTQIG